ncbi:hypothetical protein WANA13_0386 [Wolbachia endosymbiont of Drosophila ananassae]|nr:hypothetical protein WANA13_0386 [Wolbachia endosymbiont of Drosophila ananassae]
MIQYYSSLVKVNINILRLKLPISSQKNKMKYQVISSIIKFFE